MKRIKQLLKKIRKTIAKQLYLKLGIDEWMGNWYTFLIEYEFTYKDVKYFVYADIDHELKYHISNYPFKTQKFAAQNNEILKEKCYYDFLLVKEIFDKKASKDSHVMYPTSMMQKALVDLPRYGKVNIIVNENGEKYLGTFYEVEMTEERKQEINSTLNN